MVALERHADLPLRPDYTLDQPRHLYSAEDHAVWRLLFQRQARLLPGRACGEFLAGLRGLGVAAAHDDGGGVPDFERLSDLLDRATGWRIVAVPGLVPDEVFFGHLAERRFPATWWLRRRDQIDYLQEPDVFHDIYGHVPLLMNPVFADYMQAYGRGGLKAMRLNALHRLARLYWYTVEFGLIETPEGLRIYGSGILSSKGESVFCLESAAPNRLRFDLRRIMRTKYRIDTYQKTYFVIRSFAELFEATRPDFAPIYAALEAEPDLGAADVIEGDAVIARGTLDAREGGWESGRADV
ncbi:MAG TPA: phenylalanine 4-monooxygenase [Ferrovibrio sp.]|jgi:phenylalanine-4-hydroxylase|uniref:phenylalanine 4-monooxygenase n=1 Tax=Ferrovibrio sp. TaxID=1917215 RepID=UPI002ED344BB